MTPAAVAEWPPSPVREAPPAPDTPRVLDATAEGIEQQRRLLEQDIGQARHDLFVESCADWAVPYSARCRVFRPTWVGSRSHTDRLAPVQGHSGGARGLRQDATEPVEKVLSDTHCPGQQNVNYWTQEYSLDMNIYFPRWV